MCRVGDERNVSTWCMYVLHCCLADINALPVLNIHVVGNENVQEEVRDSSMNDQACGSAVVVVEL